MTVGRLITISALLALAASVPSVAWMRLLHHGRADLSLPQQEEATAFVLALTFRATADEYAWLAAESFPEIYESAASWRLSDKAWETIRRALPADPIWFGRCSRLREGLLTLFSKNDWPSEPFVLCMREEALLEEVLGGWRRPRIQKRFLQRVARDVVEARIPAAKGDRRLMKRYLGSSR